MEDLTLHEVDEDGAIREAFAAVSGNTRAEFLGKMVVGGSALLAALTAPGAGQALTPARRDVAILNYALSLEYLQAAFYTETERVGGLSGEIARVPRQVGAVERAHVTAIQKVLGHGAVKKPAFNFRGVTEQQAPFLRTAVAFEDLAVAAYKGAAAQIQSPGFLAAALSIHSVEARHAAWMRYLIGIRPAASPFDEPKPQGEVRSIVASTHFIVSKPRMTARRKAPRFTG